MDKRMSWIARALLEHAPRAFDGKIGAEAEAATSRETERFTSRSGG
jgi:hypothetical protein